MVAAARVADPDGEYLVADAAALPFSNGHADLGVAFMSLMDVDDMPRSLIEVARVLEPGGRVALAVVHPINSGHVLDPRASGGQPRPRPRLFSTGVGTATSWSATGPG
jgi:ubiquinone/menaquinone biosynthesis C-methylase UbiE